MSLEGKRLLSQNSELRPHGIWNWTLPAYHVTLPDGSRMNVCPNAGVCARVCYARFNTYKFKNVMARHIENLLFTLNDLNGWKQRMFDEVNTRRFQPTYQEHDLDHDTSDDFLNIWSAVGGRSVRIHDSGDFYSLDYLNAWVDIATTTPHVLFYAYTKEVSLLRSVELPTNFRVVFSLGGLEDHLLDLDTDRHAEVFVSQRSLDEAGYYDQGSNDLLAVTAPSNRIGIVANNIPVAIKRFNGRTMSNIVVR